MEYQRLTMRDNIGCFKYDLKDFKHKIGEFGDYDAFFAYSMAVKRLGELEDKIEAGKLVFIDEPFWSEYHDCWAVFQRTEDIVQTCYMTANQAKDYKAEKRLEEIRNEKKSIDNSKK